MRSRRRGGLRRDRLTTVERTPDDMMRDFGHAIVRTLGIGLILVLVAGCSQNGGSDAADGSAGRTTERIESNPLSSELFERPYGYLISGDTDFTRLAPNYSTLRPFNPDTAIVVTTHAQEEGLAKPPDDYKDYLHIRVNRAMTVRVIIADSTGAGRIVYEYDELPEGEYTVGSAGWPLPQIDQTKDAGWVYVYVVGGNRFRWRERFTLDENRNLVPLLTESTAVDG
jgi:hypothetical protein